MIGFENEFSFGELGKSKNRKKTAYEPHSKSKAGSLLHKVIHVANKANPATVLLRNGVLASMKLNLFKAAQRLKWAYLSDEEARKKGIDMAKFERLKKVRAKLESIYFGSGGKPENLKNAILKGKGNRGHDVSGFDGSYDELSDLGEPATGAAIASASAIIASIAGILKGIGNIFPKKEEGSADFENTESGEQGATSSTTLDEKKTVAPSITDDGKANPESNVAPSSESTPNAMMRAANTEAKEAKADEEEDDPKKKETDGIWEKNKKWMKPTLIGVGGAGILYLGYKAFTSRKPPPPATKSKPLQGVHKRKKSIPKKSARKKQVIHKQSLF